MEQPTTLHWHSATHDYSAMLEADLFGGWTLITSSGAHAGGAGRVRRKQFASFAEGEAALRRLRKRHRHGGDALCGGAFSALASLDPHGRDARAATANALARVFERWGLSVTEQAGLLRVGGKDMERYLDGHPLADDAGLLARVADVMAIHKVLRLRFADDTAGMRAWLRRPCASLEQDTPLARMLAIPDGLAGVRQGMERAADTARGCRASAA
jgi:hypothetical protein